MKAGVGGELDEPQNKTKRLVEEMYHTKLN